MRATRFFAIWVVFVSLAPFVRSQVTTDEAKMHFRVDSRPELELPLVNSTSETLQLNVHLELLDTHGKTGGLTDVGLTVAPGAHAVLVPWGAVNLPTRAPSELYWYRLAYRITPPGGSPLEGIVQLGKLIPTLFRLRISGSQYQWPVRPLPLRVYIDDPITGKPLAGIPVQAEVDLNLDSPGPNVQDHFTLRARTDSHGYALLPLKAVRRVGAEPAIEVKAQRGALEESESVELRIDAAPRMTVSTDKPIYQPGQALHLRVLAFDPNKNAIAGSQVTVKITGDDGNVQFQQTVKTSRFGVAQAEWEIPAKGALGPHRIRAEMEAGGGHSEGSASANVQISRYDLPQFTVQPVTDKPYYLPGDQVKVEISAGYLFGQPVTRGHVRIARSARREWDSEKQQWKDDGEDLEQGEFDASGKFSAVLDLSEQFEELGSHDYLRFQDVGLVAYVTDLSTQRTEQRRFTARLSKQPIHIYVVNRARSLSGPLDLFITTALPDGTPASMNVEVSALESFSYSGNQSDRRFPRRAHLSRIHTNRYGVGHLRGPSVEGLFAAPVYGFQLEMVASGGNGLKGTHTEEVWTDSGESYLKVTPARRLLRDQESVKADIQSSLSGGMLFVELTGAGGLVRSQKVELRHSHAQVEFPWEPEFRNSLNLVVYSLDEDVHAASAEVLYPGPQDLDLGLQIRKTTYKPGESAVARFQVRSPDGRPVESALGIVVFDQAVAERVRSDADFGHYGFFYGDYWDGWQSSIAGVSYRDLIRQPLTGPVDPDRELLAQALLSLSDGNVGAGRFTQGGEDFSWNAAGVFSELLKRSLAGLDNSLTATANAADACPVSRDQLVELLARSGFHFNDLRDPWGMTYEAAFRVEQIHQVVEIVSHGPGKRAGNDFIALKRFCGPYFAPVGRAIDSASVEYTRRTGEHIHDYATLARELLGQGIDLNTLKDPWGHPYRFTFDIEREYYETHVTSAGPDGIFSTVTQPSYDDVREWDSRVHYFERETVAINAALEEYRRKEKSFPATEAELNLALQSAGIDLGSMRDLWGRPYRVAFSQYSRYSNSIHAASVSSYGSGPQQVSTITPVTQTLGAIELYSLGPENKPEGRFTIAKFERLLTEQNSKDPGPHPASTAAQVTANGTTGAITGTVTDSSGAVVAGAQVKATNSATGVFYDTASSASGEYELINLVVGLYKVEISAKGFQTSVVQDVPVSSSNVTRVDAKLAVGETSMTVEVTAESPMIETTNAQVASVKQSGVAVHEDRQAFTPKVRKYFPETLVWQPELITGRDGRGELKFQMADNITAWKVSVVGSTADGQMGFAEKELRTFLPFFA
ncbi:MAG TPA: MG2 domain-containing protein, partial [Candidatus Saccharimonadales bacterium]|nr:MG2 domain-containing protein [Candidatus Saccharimonadales bacterium]